MHAYLDPKALPNENMIHMWVNRYTQNTDPTWIFSMQPFAGYWNWCEKNCTGKFDCTLPDNNKRITWLFEQARDATMFRLRWYESRN